MATRILVADDHQMVRDGLRVLIEQQPDLELVAEAADGRSAVALTDQLSPDVVVMDVGMPDLSGVEATRKILSTHPEIKVVGLSMHSDSRYVSGMLDAGASGYVLKEGAFEELADAIHAVVQEATYLSPGLPVLEEGRSGARLGLTPREGEVLKLLAEGKSSKQISADLQMSVKTVEAHRHKVMRKLDLHTIADLTKYAIREGITALEA
jgi:DNA-binding NarL/FixJ family response regulator